VGESGESPSKGLPEAAGTAGGSERVALCHARTGVAEERAILFSATPDLAQASTGWDKELLITVLYGSLRCQPGVLARPVRLDLWLSAWLASQEPALAGEPRTRR